MTTLLRSSWESWRARCACIPWLSWRSWKRGRGTEAVEYRPLSGAQLDLLAAPGYADAKLAWSSLSVCLHSFVSMLSVTHPRPLYWDDRFDREGMLRDPELLRGTPFHEPAVRNVRAALEIERMLRERGAAPEVHAAVDRYLDALLDEFEAIRLYPELPTPKASHGVNGVSGSSR